MTKILRNKSNIDLDYPICRPSLDLDFTQEVLDPRITFSRGSIGTRVNRNRLIETVAANQPRFDYDPVTGECKGLLIEEPRTNLITYSEDFSNASWARSNQNINKNVITAPDGTLTADELVTINPDTNHVLFKSPSLSSNTYTLSIFAKAAEQNLMRLRIDDGIIARNTIFNLTTGSVSSNTNVTSSTITPYSNGWYRCSITVTTNIINLVFNTPYPYSGDGTSGIYIWGAQLEVGAFPTSYIPTTASTVTRSAEIAEMTGTNFSSWYNQSEGTFVFDGTLPFITNDTVVRVPYGVSNGFNFSNSMYVAKTSTSLALSFSIINNNVSQSTGTSLPNMTSSKFKIASSVAPNNIYSCGYGGTVNKHSRPSAAIPTVNRLTLGKEPWNSGASNPIIGCITRFTYYPRALKPNQLQYLTQ